MHVREEANKTRARGQPRCVRVGMGVAGRVGVALIVRWMAGQSVAPASLLRMRRMARDKRMAKLAKSNKRAHVFNCAVALALALYALEKRSRPTWCKLAYLDGCDHGGHVVVVALGRVDVLGDLLGRLARVLERGVVRVRLVRRLGARGCKREHAGTRGQGVRGHREHREHRGT